jgi:hypothetical protein
MGGIMAISVMMVGSKPKKVQVQVFKPFWLNYLD